MSFNELTAWEWDWQTAFWIAWMGAFFVKEFHAVLVTGYEHTLTAHLRPVLISSPLVWFLAFGLWCWLGVHFLAPLWEQRIIEFLTGKM